MDLHLQIQIFDAELMAMSYLGSEIIDAVNASTETFISYDLNLKQIKRFDPEKRTRLLRTIL